MADQLVLEEPSSKKSKLSSPNLMQQSSVNDTFDWLASSLPDELLEPSSSGFGDDGGVAGNRGNTLHNDGNMPPSFNCLSNGPPMGPSSVGVSHIDNSFSSGQQHSAGGLGGSQPSQMTYGMGGGHGPPGSSSSGLVNTNCGSSVLEELLTNKTNSSVSSLPPQHQQQNSAVAPNVVLPPATHQRTPPSGAMAGAGGLSNYSRSPMMNSLASPPSGQTSTNINNASRQMPVFASDSVNVSLAQNVYGGNAMVAGGGGHPPQYAVPGSRMPPPNLGQPQSQLQQTQQNAMMGGPRGPAMNGPQMGLNMRGPRPGNMAGGPPPNQQVMSFMPMQQPNQPQHMNAGVPQMQMRMNGPTPSHLPVNHPPYQQDTPGQQYQMGQPPMPGGMRPKMEYGGPPQVPPNVSGSFPPVGVSGMPPNQRNLQPRMPSFTSPNSNMSNNIGHMNTPSNMDLVGGPLSNMSIPGLSGQPHSNAGSLPPSVSSMLMSPNNNLLNGPSGPPTPADLNSGPMSVSGAPQDPEKRKLIQQQLVLLLHAHKCQQRERTNDQQPCALPHCATMKSVLTHMTKCQEGRSCTVPHCASSRQIISHWKNCARSDCPVCLPLKQMTDNKNSRPGMGGSTSVAQNGALAQVLADGAGTANGPRFPGRPMSNANFDQGMGDGGMNPGAPFRGSIRPSLAAISASISAPETGVGFPPRLPPPEGASVQKEWHRQVTQDLRNHLVSKLVKAIFPSPDPAAIHDQRIKDLIQYARKVEKDMFEIANDREEYYHLLAEKIYKIQKELQEKKQRRLEQQQNRGPNSSNSLPLDMNAPPNRTVSLDLAQRGAASSGLPSSLAPSTNGSLSGAVNGGSGLQGSMKTEDGSCNITNSSDGLGSFSAKNESANSNTISVKTEAQDTSDGEKPSTSADGSDNKIAAKPVKKVFAVEELKSALLPILVKIERMDEAIPFRVPVDAELLQIPDYFTIVKNPMDLSTIKEKLQNADYLDPWQFCDDMWLMFENAWLYNRKTSKVYKYCTKLSEVFMDDIDPVMRTLGYCCGRKLSFTPLALVCYGQPMCGIPRDAIYYCYEDTKSSFGVSSERYTYCKKCFDDFPGDAINMSDDPNSDNLIQKKNFKQLKNDQIEYEPFVECSDCGRKWHQICGLHMDQIFPGGFVCETCLKMRNKKRLENRFTTKRLPHCKLSQHIEKRVNDYLKTKVATDQPAGEVVIRVLASSDKEVEIKPHMKAKFCVNGEMPDRFPYRAKAIFAFEVIEGVEVCFFGLHVQEYGSNCPKPNQRRVYIAYLDSVHFFTPKMLRTQVYHEILLGYLEYVKHQGYTMAHIWACPPSEGDDYIFHCHPPEQKIPKPKRLQEWYKKMLDKGIVERVVTDYKDIYEFYQKEEILTSAHELPFFEGDYWPNVVEECIREVDAEEAERKREAEALAAADAGDEVDDDQEEIFGPGKKRNAKGNKKNKSKSKSTNYKKSKKGGSGTGNDLTDKIVAALEKHKEVFFVVRLYTKQQSSLVLPPINDPDPLISCELMDGRDSFLSTARDRHWEFSSLRRAKFSTLALAYELHTQGNDKFVYTCNTCKNSNAKWHCPDCDDFDLCQACYEKSNHEHKMEPLKSLVADEGPSSAEPGAPNPRDRNESIQRCIQSLVHACQCRDANCRRMSCHKMKRVVAHTKMCRRRLNGSCPVCKQLIALCLYHARHCQEANCPVPFCQNIRQKLAEQQAQLKKKRDREMMRRINLMSNQSALPNANASSAGPMTPYQNPQQSPVPMNVAAAASGPVPGAMGQQMVNPAAVQAARDIEKIAQQQVQIGYHRPPMGPGAGMAGPRPMNAAMTGMAPIGRPPAPLQQPSPQQQQQQAPQQQQMPWDVGSPRGYHPGGGGGMQPQQLPGQNMNALRAQMGPRPGLDSMPPPSMMPPNMGLRLPHNQKVQMVLQRLKSAKTQEETEAIMKDLNREPQLLNAIIALKRMDNGRYNAAGGAGPSPAQQQQQQGGWNGPPMGGASSQMMASQQQQQPNLAQQQRPVQYYNGPPGSNVRMSQGFPPQSAQGFPSQPGQNFPPSVGQNFVSQQSPNFPSPSGQNYASQQGGDRS